MEFCLLGPLEARRGKAVVPVRPGKQRAVLAALLLQAGRVVPVDDLVDAVWESPPPSARATVRNHISRLRRQLEAPGQMLITAQAGGYSISAAECELDVTRFEGLLAAARAAARDGSWEAASEHAAAGLALWRGQPLADDGCEILAQREAPRLTELQLSALETRIDAEVRLGRHAEVTGELRRLAGLHPLRENMHALLMLALYRDGRQAEALAAYQDARAVLAGELGVEPGTELQRLHQQILTADPALAASAPAAQGSAAPRQASPAALGVRYSLPPDTAAFTGREGELAAIAAAATQAPRPGGVIAIRAIGGMPGAGKTALAVHAAHMLAGLFPDRQLFVSLHGHTPGREPVPPEDALAGLLAATGVDPRFLPADLEGRAALWRDKMVGQRTLLVLDGAASSAQVAPLLPGAGQADDGSCLVLVTSRRHLGDLPGLVAPVLVDGLPPDQAAQMFTRLAPRAANSPGEVAQITRLAGYLPLAISLLARVHNRHPSWSLSDLAAETRAGLLALKAEEDSVAAAFGVSWRHLDPAGQRFFRLLALHPGTTTDVSAAAALAGTSPREAAGMMDSLHAEGLVTETGYRRYGIHDLLRRYARDQTAARRDSETGQALDRLADYYQNAAARAPVPLPARPAAQSEPPGPPLPDDAGQALAWARGERAGILGCLDHATREGQHARVIALTAGVAELLRRDGPWTEAAARHQAAVTAANCLGDRAAAASALSDLGEIHRLTGSYTAAVRDLELALSIRRGLGDRHGEASTLSSLGDVHRVACDYQAAALVLKQALGICQDLRDRPGEARALRLLGNVRHLTGDYQAAAQDFEASLGICHAIGDRLDEATTLFSIGWLGGLTGEYEAAARSLGQALAIFRSLGDRIGEGNTLGIRGNVRRLTGEFQAAAQDLGQALAIFRDFGNRLGEANALSGLGTVLRLADDCPAAAQALDQALGIYRDIGDRGGEATALNERGEVYRACGRTPLAGRCHQQAQDLARVIGSSLDEGGALAGMGRCALAADRPADAGALLGQALEIFQRLGAAEADGVRAELAALAERPAGA